MDNKIMSKEEAYSFLYAFLGLITYTIPMFYLLYQKQKGIIFVENLATINNGIAYFICAYCFIIPKLNKRLNRDGENIKEKILLKLFSNITCFIIGTLLSVMFFIVVL